MTILAMWLAIVSYGILWCGVCNVQSGAAPGSPAWCSLAGGFRGTCKCSPQQTQQPNQQPAPGIGTTPIPNPNAVGNPNWQPAPKPKPPVTLPPLPLPLPVPRLQP